MSFNSQLDNRVGSEVSFQALAVSGVTEFASLEIVLIVIFVHLSHRRNQPSNLLKCSLLSSLMCMLSFSRIMGSSNGAF